MIALAIAAAMTPAGTRFPCAAVSVWDGDGPIRCAGGERIRLRGVAAREIDGSCRRRQPCPRASGIAARDALVALLGGAQGVTQDGHVRVRAALSCVSFGADDYRRVVAACTIADGRDLGCALVRARVVVRWRRYGGDRLCHV